MNLSFWEKEVFFKNIDAAIVGSGIVGLNAALQIKLLRPHWNVIVLERGTLPSGASTRNAGVTCFGSVSELLDDLETMSEDTVWELVEMRWQGLVRLKEKLGEQKIGYLPADGYEIFETKDNTFFEACVAHISTFNKMLKNITQHRNIYEVANEKITDFGFKNIRKGILINAEGQVHTGKMMATLLQLVRSKGVNILNGITVTDINDLGNRVILRTEQGWEIPSRQVLVATNGLTPKLFPNLALQPARNQVLITEPILNLKFQGNFHHHKGYNYFRTVGNRVLLGGGRHLAKEAETTAAFGFTDIIQSHLNRFLNEVIFPNQQVGVAQRWSGILGVGNEKRPILQRISDNVAVAVRLGGMGVAIGTLVGEEGGKLVVKG